MDNDPAVKPDQQSPVNQAPNADPVNHYGNHQFTATKASSSSIVDLDRQQYVDTMDSGKSLVINYQTQQNGLANSGAMIQSVDPMDINNEVNNMRAQFFMQNSNNSNNNHYIEQLGKKILVANKLLDRLDRKVKLIKRFQRTSHNTFNPRRVAVSRQRIVHDVPLSQSQSTILQISSASTADEPEFYPHELNGKWLHCHSCNLIHY